MFRKLALKNAGGFDEKLKSAQEYELAIRVSHFGRLRCVPKTLVIQNKSEGQISEDWDRKHSGIQQVYRKHKLAFSQASRWNWVKLQGILLLYFVAELFGNRIYSIICRMKRRHGSKRTIFFLYKHDRSFVHQDAVILSKYFNVIRFYYKGIFSIPAMLWKLRKADMAYIWFASYHAFILAFLSKKPFVVVTGGYDVAGDKEIRYGLMLNPVFRWMVGFVLKRAKTILSVSNFNKEELERHLGLDGRLVYNCIDGDRFKPGDKKENIVLTVGNVNRETWKRKGIDLFCELSTFFEYKKNVRFVVAGRIDSSARLKVIHAEADYPNVEFTDYISDEELLGFYQRAKVYCQLSFYESFGVSPAEAMLCDCIPIVSNRGALPEVVKDAGVVVNYYNMGEIACAVNKALKAKRKGVYRKRIMETFSVSRREKELVKVVEEIL
jgi:glycosyltransferase involved in cell wall biosynthesis